MNNFRFLVLGVVFLSVLVPSAMAKDSPTVALSKSKNSQGAELFKLKQDVPSLRSLTAPAWADGRVMIHQSPAYDTLISADNGDTWTLMNRNDTRTYDIDKVSKLIFGMAQFDHWDRDGDWAIADGITLRVNGARVYSTGSDMGVWTMRTGRYGPGTHYVDPTYYFLWWGGDSEYYDLHHIRLVDRTKPKVTLRTPRVSSNVSRNYNFRVRWSATDRFGIKSYVVKYRSDAHGWRFLVSNTKAKSKIFTGRPGRTYKFKVWARDNSGNVGTSKVGKTMVPYDQNYSGRIGRRGFNNLLMRPNSQYYMGTVAFSKNKNDILVFRASGPRGAKGVGIVSTKGPNRSKAKIFIDGKYVKTIDTRSRVEKKRRVVFYQNFAVAGSHKIVIKNLATPGRRRLDVDGIIVFRQ